MTILKSVQLDSFCFAVSLLPELIKQKIFYYCNFERYRNDIQLDIKYLELDKVKKFVNRFPSNHLLMIECFTSQTYFLQNFYENMFFRVLNVDYVYIFRFRKHTKAQQLEDSQFQGFRQKFPVNEEIILTICVFAFYKSKENLENAVAGFKDLKIAHKNLKLNIKTKDLFLKQH